MSHLWWLVPLDVVGVLVFSMSGALAGVRRDLDPFGVLTLAAVTGVGGGVVRDVILGDTPPPALTDWRYLVTAAVGGILILLWHPTFDRWERLILLFDAAGIAMFCVVGTLKAGMFGLGIFAAALLGMITAVGGGVIRDLLTAQVPSILRAGQYATPALSGGAIAAALTQYGAPSVASAGVGAAACLVWRVWALIVDWRRPLLAHLVARP